MRRHAWLLALAALLAGTALGEDPGSARGEFDFRVAARFLEPGRAASDEPIVLGPLRAAGPETVETTAWAWFAPVRVRAARDLSSLETRPVMHDKRLPAWDLWRHRHGYTLGLSREPSWNTLGDERLPMSPADAAFYDSYLVALYRLWTRRALQDRLAGADAPVEPPEPDGRTAVPMKLQYDETGLAEAASASFTMHQWHIPVQVGFTLVPSSSTHPAEWWFTVRGEPFVRYDKDAWRRRHAYRKTLFGYAWDDDFPGREALGEADGERLDRLMERGIGYWADAALHMGLFELDRQLKDASREFRRRRHPSAAPSAGDG